jgi:hypothetical protein
MLYLKPCFSQKPTPLIFFGLTFNSESALQIIMFFKKPQENQLNMGQITEWAVTVEKNG